MAAEAEALLASNLYSEEAKGFLRAYYANVYQKNLSALDLTNEQLPQAIDELRAYMELMSTGEWTGISEVPSDDVERPMSNGQRSIVNGQWTLDGRSVARPQQPGIYITKSRDGKVHKVLR